jgi:hypothetical protein
LKSNDSLFKIKQPPNRHPDLCVEFVQADKAKIKPLIPNAGWLDKAVVLKCNSRADVKGWGKCQLGRTQDAGG